MPVNARNLVRKMRGGAQAHLIECDDNHFYVVKFRNNPQHRRILVNEWITSAFLSYLEIACPETAVVNFSPDFLERNPEVHLQYGSQRVIPEPGWHFGSRYPGDPARISVYDFIPDVLLEKVENLAEFAGVMVVDKWMGNADTRQSIFFRARIKEWIPGSAAHPNRLGFVAHMMDHGYAFDGPHWDFPDSPLHGLYFRPLVYRNVRGLEDFQPWLDRVIHFPEEVVDDALKRIPRQWLNGDAGELESLLTKLMQRRKRVPELIRESSRSRASFFPNWR